MKEFTQNALVQKPGGLKRDSLPLQMTKGLRYLIFVLLCSMLLPAPGFGQTTELKNGNGMQDKNDRATQGEVKQKPIVDYSYKYIPPSGRQGGEDISNALPIPALPYNDAGNTCNNINDYDEVCPWTGSLSPDVVYSYTPAWNDTITIDLCGSLYDTKVFVYENTWTPGSPYACDDDFYSWGDPCGDWVSKIENLPVTVGNTYYIVIDGYSGDCGDYQLEITGVPPPPIPVSNWAIVIGALLISAFIVVRFRKRRLA